MIRWALISLLTLAQPVLAQQGVTLRDAAQANVTGLTYWCVEVMFRRAQAAQAFPAAGFTYRKVDRGVNEYGIHRGSSHYFDAPANTAHAEVDDTSRPAGLCTVYTTHLNQADMAAIVGRTLYQYFPTTEQFSPTSWHISLDGGLPLIIELSTIQNNHRYETPGTVRVSMTYPG